MALGVDGMRAGKVVRKAIFLTLGTAIFIFCLTLVYESMRAVHGRRRRVRVGRRVRDPPGVSRRASAG